MPLVAATLETSIKDLIDDPSDTAAGAAQKWSDAIGDYASAIVMAPTTTGEAAKAALLGALTATFGNPTDGTPPVSTTWDAPMAAFAGTLAGGMAPAFTGTPPGAGFSSVVFTGANFEDSGAAAAALSASIDGWFKTGIAVNNSSGASSTWS
tara:strand:+ start:985 stop:1440 length:456 start_codon:yes stop_codon:yes gene_type:complete